MLEKGKQLVTDSYFLILGQHKSFSFLSSLFFYFRDLVHHAVTTVLFENL